MSVAKVIEVTASSTDGFEDAVRKGVEKAGKTVNNITAAWINEQSVVVKANQVAEYRVNMRVTFVLE